MENINEENQIIDSMCQEILRDKFMALFYGYMEFLLKKKIVCTRATANLISEAIYFLGYCTSNHALASGMTEEKYNALLEDVIETLRLSSKNVFLKLPAYKNVENQNS